MIIGITGASGFLGWHFQCYLYGLEGVEQVRLATRKTFSSSSELYEFLDGTELIIHLAGVNRSDGDIYEENLLISRILVDGLISGRFSPDIIVSSSIYAEDAKTLYGRSKRDAARLISSWGESSGARVLVGLIPHIFGEFGKPFYNSAFSTFCYQLINDIEPSVNGDGKVELIHAQEVCRRLFDLYMSGSKGEVRLEGKSMSVSSVVDMLKDIHNDYWRGGVVPDLSSDFDRDVFNSYRSYIPWEQRKVNVTSFYDSRGELFELVKVRSGGQLFVSHTKPGITRGNHFHKRKFERFFVLEGRAKIGIRKMFSDALYEYHIEPKVREFIDIPTLCAHSIINTGNSDLITAFWSSEVYNPLDPDTFSEVVSLEA